jgi:nitrile hydratase
MGGRFGDGPVDPGTPDDPPFKADWQARAHALTAACMPLGPWNIDMRRHARERLAPADYARFAYYEKWLAGLADMLVQGGVLDADELTDQAPGPPRPEIAARKLTPATVAASAGRLVPYHRPGPEPRFRPGDAIVTRRRPANRLVPGGHTRLPGYAAAARGTIRCCHGAHVFPDSNAHGLGEAPEPLYSVIFRAGELWQAPEHPDDQVMIDLWESYLEPAD